jgi:tape measure domain-containing protein
MANETIRARIEVLLKGMDQVESLKNAVRQLQTTASPAAADLQKLKNAALQLGGASDRTENDLRRSINALKDVRAQLSLTDAEYRKLTGTINKYQAQLDRATGAQQRGGKALQFAQTAGAVAASGVFGGPEGLVGAGIGAAFGGAAGALAGGAVGAQVGIFRQQIAVTADYAAQIEKLRIATKGVVGDQQNYERALAAAADVTNRLNVPLLESTQGMTKLSASVIGAGGKVTDAEVVFRNVTAAIKATGGGAEEVQGSLLAMSQIFSKGKVSAEELQGQLGERLPGAVTMFAEATGRSLPQLQKDLEQGVVGLNDVMKFVVALGERYTATAEKISKSDADAGARFARDLKNFQQQFGEALLPVGAQIQDAFGNLLRDVGPTLISTAKQIALAFKAIVDNAEIIGNIARLALRFGALTLAVKAFVALRPGIVAAFTALQTGGAQAAAAAALATPKVVALRAAIGGLLKLGIVTVIIDVLVRGISKIVELRQQIKELRDYDPAADYAGKTREEVQGAVNDAKKSLSKAQKDLAEYNSKEWARFWVPGARLFLGSVTDKQIIETQIAKAQKTLNALDPLKFPTQVEVAKKELEDLQKQLSKFAEPSDGSAAKDKTDKAKKEAERLAAEQQRLNEATARAEIELQNAVFRNQMDLVRRRFDYEEERIRQQRDVWAGTFEGIRSESARSFIELQNRLGDLRRRLFESDLGIRQAQQELTSATRMEATTSGGTVTTGIVARTGNTGQSTGAHLDLRWGDGRPITKADADKYFLVNGKAPSSFGVTSPYGPRSLFGRSFHSGIDFGTPAGSGISLRGGATFGRDLGNTGAGGYAIEVMTPEGTMRALHLMAGSAMRTAGGPAGAGAQARRDVRAEGQLGIAGAGLDQARALAGMDRAQVQGLEALIPQQFAQQQTQGLRDQAKALEDNNALFSKRIELEAQGLRPEIIDAQMRIAEIELQRTDKLAQLNENLRIATEQQDPTLIASVRSEIELTTAAYDRQIAAVTALAQVQTAAGVALASRIGQLRQELEQLSSLENFVVNVSRTIETSLSTAISSAVTNFATGAGSIKQTLADMFKSIGDAFIKMAADIIAKQLIIVALNSIAKVFGGGGGGLKGFSGAGPFSQAGGWNFEGPGMAGFATGGVMTSRGPLPLKRYATGGVARSPQVAMFGERGPEAYVPLPDGRSIPVKMRTEALNRYRPAGSNGGGMSDSGDAGDRSATAPRGGGAIDVRYESTVINNVEYVTAEQFRAGIQRAATEGAQRGTQNTLKRLQQSPSTRRKVGI